MVQGRIVCIELRHLPVLCRLQLINMFCKASGIFFIVFLLWTTSVFPQETLLDQVNPVFLDTLVALAKKNYPRTKYFEAKSKASEQTLKAQKLSWFDPASFSYQYLPNNQVNAVNPVFLNGYQIGVYLNVGTLIQKPALTKKARQEWVAATSEQAEYDKILEAEVKRRYYHYLLQVNLLRVYSKSVLDADGLMHDLSVRYQKSEVSFEEYSKALIVYNGNLESKLEVESNLLAAQSSVEELVGVKLDEIKINGSK